MADRSTCPECGAALVPGTSLGACPRCLLAAGLVEGGASGHATDDVPSAGELAPLFPELEILSFIGRGGMGVVYKARQIGLDRIAALKVLPASLHEDPAFAERFGREARTMAHLDHPNIVRVHDFGERQGRFFLLMELVEGPNLRQVIDDGGLEAREALRIVPQICEALQYAHDRGVVHRDIKPANVLIDRSGRVKITDFGLAKLLGPGDAEHTITRAGQVMGTPRYMAPEQMLTPDDVDHRADIYSLGVVFYEMLTGDLPMGRFDPPSRKVEVDVRLDEVVLRTLEREREQRYQRAEDVSTQVASIVDSPEPVFQAEPPPQVEAEVESPRLSRLALWGFLCTLAPFALIPAMMGIASMTPVAIPFALTGITLTFAAIALGFILSLSGWIVVARGRGRLTGLGLAIAGTLLSVLIVFPAAMFLTYLLLQGEADVTPEASFGRSEAPALPGMVPPPVASRETRRQAYASEIQATWRALQDVTSRPKITPADLEPFTAQVDRRRVDLVRPEDRKRLVGLELLGLAYSSIGRDVLEFEVEEIGFPAGDVPLADLTLRRGGEVLNARLVRDGETWHVALAPVTRRLPLASRWTGAKDLVRDGPDSDVERRMIQTEVELLWGILQRYWEAPDLPHRSRVPAADRRWLLHPGRSVASLGLDGAALFERGAGGALGMLFMDAARLPHPLGAYALEEIRVSEGGKRATVVVRAEASRFLFVVGRAQGRWWYTLEPVET